MTADELFEMELRSLGRSGTLVGTAQVGGALLVVFDADPIALPGGEMHERRWAVVMPAGNRAGGVVATSVY